MDKEMKLFVVKIFNEKRDGFIEYLFRAESKAAAIAHFAEARKATADDVERLLKVGK